MPRFFFGPEAFTKRNEPWHFLGLIVVFEAEVLVDLQRCFEDVDGVLLLDVPKVFLLPELFELPGLKDIVNRSHREISLVASGR